MKYKFLGKPDRHVYFYKKGKIYDLLIETATSGILWWKKEYPIIISPKYCPYGSWGAFDKNWELIK